MLQLHTDSYADVTGSSCQSVNETISTYMSSAGVVSQKAYVGALPSCEFLRCKIIMKHIIRNVYTYKVYVTYVCVCVYTIIILHISVFLPDARETSKSAATSTVGLKGWAGFG